MEWDVEFTDEFEEWWASLSMKEQERVNAAVILLERFGPSLGYPHSSQVKSSRHPHMRELRIQHRGDQQWYVTWVPIAMIATSRN